MRPHHRWVTTSLAIFPFADSHFARALGTRQWKCVRTFIQKFPISSIFAQLHGRHLRALYSSSATGAAHVIVASAEATSCSAEWRSLCRTRGAYTGGAALTGAAVSSFFDLLLVFLSSSFVAAFMSHHSMFWGTCCSALIWGCTSQTQYVLCCLDCEGSMRGNCACSSHPRVVLSVGYVVERPRRGACEGLDRLSQKRAPPKRP